MQEQVENNVRIPGTNQRFIRRIGNTFDATELVILDTRRIERFSSGNDVCQKSRHSNVLLRKVGHQNRSLCFTMDILNRWNKTGCQCRACDPENDDPKSSGQSQSQQTSDGKPHEDDPEGNGKQQPMLNCRPARGKDGYHRKRCQQYDFITALPKGEN